MEVLETPMLYAQANNLQLPYGGADQMALHILLHYVQGKDVYSVTAGDEILSVRMGRCENLNETYSVPITEDAHIIHYKGGWRSILFEGSPFTKNRTRSDSWEMFVQYHQIFQKAVAKLNQATGKQFVASKDFGLSEPFYFDTTRLEARPGLYPVYWMLWQILNFFRASGATFLIAFDSTPLAFPNNGKKCRPGVRIDSF